MLHSCTLLVMCVRSLKLNKNLRCLDFNFGFAIEKHNQTLFNQQMFKVRILPKPTTLTKETTMKKHIYQLQPKQNTQKKKMIVTIF
jgi:hypothetical protein